MTDRHASMRVLFIEDSPSDAALLAVALLDGTGGERFSVQTAPTLAKGLAILEGGGTDVVLLDLNLPDSDGFATFERVLAAAPDKPVVILTSHGDEEIALRAVEAGAQDFIHKDRLEPYWLQRAVTYAVRRSELQERLRKVEAREAAAAHLANEARAAFFASMSHEIRAPLSVLVMAAEVAGGLTVSPEERADMLGIVRANGAHLKALIDDLLDFAKVEAGKLGVALETVPTRATLDEAVALLAPAFKAKSVTLGVTMSTDLPDCLQSDPLRLRQIICNLVSNALKFTPPGGAVSVSACRVKDQNRIEVLVTDTGCGIDPKHASSLFQPFSQASRLTANREGGTGLGLALSRQLARALGGDAELVSSVPGHGSTFRATIAIGTENPAAEVPVDKTANIDVTRRLAGLRLLVADDSAGARRLYRLLLEAEGAKVDAVADGHEAVGSCRDDAHDAVLLDLEMPVMDGLTAVQALRARGFRGAILAISAHAGEVARRRCLEAGFDAFLSKPLDRCALTAALAEALTRRQTSAAREFS